jgi:pimeloyl-ACP methyl ester carboxylesterase
VFPYDWRKPNADHIATLHTYIQRIRELHDGAKVNLVVHSMGGLVMRRYVLEHGSDDLDKVVTVGSPILGAPEVAYRMLTGSFFYIAPVDSINGRLMKNAIATMPSVYELLPSTLYLQNWGFPIFEEKGYDYNGNGLALEAYDTVRLRAMLDTEAEPFNAARNNLLFHTVRQDDWHGHDGTVDYLQIVGKQAEDDTTVGVTVESTTFIGAFDFFEPYPSLNFTRVVGQGDGTVPILSSRRLPELLAPGTLVREIEGPLSDSIFGTLPAGKSAEHTEMMANTEVLNLITEFFDASPATATVAAATAAPQSRKRLVSAEDGPTVPPLAEVLDTPGLDDITLTSNIPVPEIAVEHPLGTDLVDSAASTNFGRVPLGRQQQRTFTIRNIATTDLAGLGRTDLTGLTASLTGTDHADFSVGNLAPTSLLPGASTELVVTFSPRAGNTTNRTAVLHLASNDVDENPFDIVLTGTSPGRKRISILGASYLTVHDGQGG